MEGNVGGMGQGEIWGRRGERGLRGKGQFVKYLIPMSTSELINKQIIFHGHLDNIINSYDKLVQDIFPLHS